MWAVQPGFVWVRYGLLISGLMGSILVSHTGPTQAAYMGPFWAAHVGPTCMMHSDAIWNDVLEVGTAVKMLKAKTQNGAFCRYLKRFLGSWNCWRKKWNQGRCMVHSDAIWNDLLEVGTAVNSLRAWTQHCAFWCCLKRCFGSWNCLEQFETKEAKWCIRTLFEECGRRLSGELLIVEICSSLK